MVNCFSCITRVSFVFWETGSMTSLIVFDLIFSLLVESEARWSLIREGMAVTEQAIGLGIEGQNILIASPCISSILGLAYALSIPGHMSVNFLFSSLVSHFGQHPAYCAQPILQDHKCLGCADLLPSLDSHICLSPIYRPFTSQWMPALHLSLTACLTRTKESLFNLEFCAFSKQL